MRLGLYGQRTGKESSSKYGFNCSAAECRAVALITIAIGLVPTAEPMILALIAARHSQISRFSFTGEKIASDLRVR